MSVVTLIVNTLLILNKRLLDYALGMTQMVFAINNDTLMSLMGHLIFGVITGVSFVFLKERLTT